MFDKIKIITSPDDLGQFAELSLFYEKIYFSFNEGFYNSIRKQPVPERFIEFIIENSDNFFPFYNYDQVVSNIIAPKPFGDNTITYSIGGYESVGDVDFLDYYYGKNIWGQNGRPFIDMIEYKKTNKKILDILYEDMNNDQLFKYLATQTNIDIDLLAGNMTTKRNESYISISLKNLPLYLIEKAILKYLNKLKLLEESSVTNFDFVSNGLEQLLLSKEVEFRLKEKEIFKFNELVLNDTLSVRYVINSQRKTLNDYYALYKKSGKFKQWLSNLDSESSLIKDYYHDVIKTEWTDKMPSKSMRWILFESAGLGLDALGLAGIGALTGIALSAFDSFVLDKIIKGWKPNHFVDEEYIPFIVQEQADANRLA